ncbi:hypothetical protein CROQUDRAFT_726435, partial [Cronartium quercuum f. sp. fusiforme G11]
RKRLAENDLGSPYRKSGAFNGRSKWQPDDRRGRSDHHPPDHRDQNWRGFDGPRSGRGPYKGSNRADRLSNERVPDIQRSRRYGWSNGDRRTERDDYDSRNRPGRTRSNRDEDGRVRLRYDQDRRISHDTTPQVYRNTFPNPKSRSKESVSYDIRKESISDWFIVP